MRVLLIDSSAVLYRCFHGYPPQMAQLPPRGHFVDVAALTGYLQYTRNLERDFSFDRIVHVLDPEGGSKHRLALYPAYKATRPPADPIFTAQKILLQKVLAAFGQRFLCLRGVESDDVLATLAEHHAARGDKVLVVSPDKDLLQLVRGDSIGVARRSDRDDGMGKTHEVFTEEGVFASLGVRPDQVADYLAMIGDTADNIPGIHKVGKKTAAKWLEQHGDLSTFITQAGSMTGKVAEHVHDALPHLPLYRQLTTVLRNVPGALPMDEEPILELTAQTEVRRWLNIPISWPDRLLDNWTPSPFQAPNATAVGNGLEVEVEVEPELELELDLPPPPLPPLPRPQPEAATAPEPGEPAPSRRRPSWMR